MYITIMIKLHVFKDRKAKVNFRCSRLSAGVGRQQLRWIYPSCDLNLAQQRTAFFSSFWCISYVKDEIRLCAAADYQVAFQVQWVHADNNQKVKAVLDKSLNRCEDQVWRLSCVTGFSAWNLKIMKHKLRLRLGTSQLSLCKLSPSTSSW